MGIPYIAPSAHLHIATGSLHGWALLNDTVCAADLVDNRRPEMVAADQ
jgi:hypothetical protein